MLRQRHRKLSSCGNTNIFNWQTQCISTWAFSIKSGKKDEMQMNIFCEDFFGHMSAFSKMFFLNTITLILDYNSYFSEL